MVFIASTLLTSSVSFIPVLDFTKRRFCAYNPRYDLDLLIVPPPIPAFDLIKDNKNVIKTQKMEGYLPQAEQGQPPQPLHQINAAVAENALNVANGIDTLDRHAPTYELNNSETNPSETSNGGDVHSNGSSNGYDGNNNTIAITCINDTVNNNTSNSFVHSLYKSPSNSVKLLPVIKEENIEGRKKLENHIAMIRGDPSMRGSPTDISYSLSMKQERTMSPITVGSSRT